MRFKFGSGSAEWKAVTIIMFLYGAMIAIYSLHACVGFVTASVSLFSFCLRRLRWCVIVLFGEWIYRGHTALSIDNVCVCVGGVLQYTDEIANSCDSRHHTHTHSSPISFVAYSCTDKARGLSKYCTMARKQWTVPIPPPISHTRSHKLQHCKLCVCVSGSCVWKNDWHCLSSLLLWTEQNTPAPLPFILISILNDKPSQSHSRPVCTPPPPPPPFFLQPGVDPPQNPSEAATVLLCLHPSLPPTHLTPPPLLSLLAPSPCPGRCWLAGTEACLDRNAGGGEEGREWRKEGGRDWRKICRRRRTRRRREKRVGVL